MHGYGGGYGSNYPQQNDPFQFNAQQPPSGMPLPPGSGAFPPYSGGGPPPATGGFPLGFDGGVAYGHGGVPPPGPGYPSQPSGFPQASYSAGGVSGTYQQPAPGGYMAGAPPPSTGGGYMALAPDSLRAYSSSPVPGYPTGGPVPSGPSGYVGAPDSTYQAHNPMGGYAPGAPPSNVGVGYAPGAPPSNVGVGSNVGYPVVGGAPSPMPGGIGGGYQAAVNIPPQMGGGYSGESAPPSMGYGQPAAYPGVPGATYMPSYAGQHQGGYNQPGAVMSMGSAEHYQGTIRPDPSFLAETDCNTLRKAMRGLGTDEQAIINVLTRRSSQQRQQIKVMYKTMFGKDLIQELKSELSGRFEDVILALLMDPIYYDAYCLREAMRGAGTNEKTVTEIMCTRTNEQIRYIKDVYRREYNHDLERDLVSETSGFYQRVLVACAQANRQELTPQQLQLVASQGVNSVVDRALAQREAQELLQAGVKRVGTDESCFIRIIATRNMYQLRATFEEYQKVAGHDILTAIDREMSGDFGEAMKSLALSQINRPLYFAQRLYNSMRGLGTADRTLIRVIVTRSEIDLADVKREFQRAYNKPLETWVRDDTSGDYRKVLLAILAGN